MSIQKIGVAGAGTMGNGIAQCFAASGHDVVLFDIAQGSLDRALKTIAGSFDRLIKKGALDETSKQAALARITTTLDLNDFKSCQLVVEAASENFNIKSQLFKDLDALMPAEAILASNTSSISITKLATVTQRADRIIGMHFFNPVPMMALVELIRGLHTSDATFTTIESLSKAIGKTPVQVRNNPGFVVNRLLCPMLNEAIFVLSEGVASAAEIDESMKLGLNHPIGPLALCDLIGLDVVLAIMQVLYEGFKDSKYRPAPLLIEMVEAGLLGRKSGRGFFDYA